MSDGESSTGFTEFKDNTTNETIVDLPHSQPTKTTNSGFAIESNPHPAWSMNWAMHYLSQTRIMVMLVLTVFFFSLIIAVYSMGAPAAHKERVLCPEWKEVVPDASSRCPKYTLELMYPNGEVTTGQRFTLSDNMLAEPPLAVFLPHASSQYYYTLIVVDPDSPSKANPLRQTIVGLATNLRLSESISLTDKQWLYSWSAKTGNGEHRFVFLVYRHTKEYHGLAPQTRQNVNLDTWFKENWSMVPELVAANYFKVREN